jgi:predicted RNA-binding protein with PIN domain
VAAVAGSRQRPPLPVPPSVEPYLRFQKLPTPALGPIRRAVEADDVWRQRLASVATEEIVGRAGWLWLHRPEGWYAELEALVAEGAAEEDEKAQQKATKRLAAAEEKLRRIAAEVHAAKAELLAERGRRHETEAALHRLERRASQLDIELRGARRRVAEADERVAAAVAEIAAANAEAEKAHAEAADVATVLAALQADLAAVVDDPAPAPPEPTLARPEPSRPVPSPVPAEPQLAVLAEALRDAAAAGSRLAEALAAAGAALAPRAVAAPVAAVEAPGGPAPRPNRPPRRVPLPIPGGLFEDSIEAATHLVRTPGVLVVVDGYNVAKLGWPALALVEQRERLLDTLDEVVLRLGARIQVVFDGADVIVGSVRRRLARVEFSPPEVIADDVIVEQVGAIPAEVPVVVVTNDDELRGRVRALGANIVSSDHLLAIARRAG